ncbi:FAD binding-containing protein [Coleophoma cylindrospora]|uniref:FAD binding-containing protein n=1 Tax=Coleophoma cylindrospora TaxID=1849047 RepID=A0A3D8QD07_9HELO|nr:FAD binding-containing protein [Coleophoma cylindrospora]
MQFPSMLLLLSVLTCHVTAESMKWTLDEVDEQVTAFANSIKNGVLYGTSAALSDCVLACSFLNFALPGQISYPNSTTYAAEAIYWSVQQTSASPKCRLSPNSATDVSLGVLTARVTQCQFAVKSGGHVPFFGASNIDGGMTIDLINLNQITVAANKTQTSVGPGNRWYDVYTRLDPMGLSVIGGRVSDIGVGGLTLGGGISFFSGRYGWACDNVNVYQVVFADGSIHDVSYQSNPDLYYALRGGGNNFGIVTRFDLATFPQGDLWAGSQTFLYDNSTAAALNAAFYNFNINAVNDPYAAVILAYAYAQAENIYVIASDLQYGKPVVNPPILQNFTAVPSPIADTLKIQNLSALTVEFQASNPYGFRQTFWALMVQNDAELMNTIVSIFQSETNGIVNASGLVASCVFQPITVPMLSHFSKNGGNALGLSASDGPLNLVEVDISWSDAADDERIYAVARSIIQQANATAYERGLGNRFLYQNYAAEEQDVFASYGEENLKKLRSVAKRYDPAAVWQRLQPGYFKLGIDAE